ncbi:uncharacterized protein N7518_006655 [Penicillium psychrosexuale]|uniref:uncharacterized protein n=1 Tax=Penicillium psychrosexuale TaxID=1002107 RepID=UPI002544F36E|nr:uncharacterized protein N7518_006655 [Penicillium psychrosexuale]KAJ5789644.1 hypothetical protein N7518_006655 [Penicillium psychrosexuale]
MDTFDDSLQELPDEISRLQVKAPLVLSTPLQIGQAEKAKELLKGQIAGIFSGATMHTPMNVTTLLADSVISIGGESTIGLGKAISIRTRLPHILYSDYIFFREMTPILSETANGLKKTCSEPKILPGTVIYDVDLTMTSPVPMSATSGPRFFTRATRTQSSTWALEGIRALASSLPEIIEKPSSQSARSKALYGAWLCGTCLGSVDMSFRSSPH